MAARADLAIVGLVLAGIALVLAAPLLGRSGEPLAADLAVIGAAAAGLGAFGLALLETLRAMQRSGTGKEEDPR